MGKAFEKQIKTIEDQEGKQIKAVQDPGHVKTIKKYDYDDHYPLLSKQKEIFNELIDKRIKEMTELNEKVNRDNLIYRYKGNTAIINSDQFDHAFSLFDKIRNGKISLTNAKNDQEKFRSNLSEIKRGNKKHKSYELKNTMYKISILNRARNKVIKFFDDYSSMVSEAKLKATKGTGLKILTPKQLLQRLPIALGQVKAGNNSENLLNEIRQLFIFCINQKKSLKKYITT